MYRRDRRITVMLKLLEKMILCILAILTCTCILSICVVHAEENVESLDIVLEDNTLEEQSDTDQESSNENTAIEEYVDSEEADVDAGSSSAQVSIDETDNFPVETMTLMSAQENTYKFSLESIETLKDYLNSYASNQDSSRLTWDNEGKLTKMSIDSGLQLVLLSNSDPVIYQNTIFESGTVTGNISLTDTVDIAGDILVFQGFGSEDTPFKGEFGNSGFSINKTLFNNIDYSKAVFSNDTVTLDWLGDASVGAMFALEMSSNADKKLTISISNNSKTMKDALINHLSGNLNLSIAFPNVNFENKVSENYSNAGSIINTFENGTLNLTISSLPKSISIGSNKDFDNGNTGTFIGYMKDSTLHISCNADLPSSTIHSQNGGAGALIGRISGTGVSTIDLLTNINLSKVRVSGYYSGGLVGYAKDVSLVSGNAHIVLPSTIGYSDTNIAGGTNISSLYSGGVFGYLENQNENATYDLSGCSFDYGTAINLYAYTENSAIGGIVGKLVLGQNRNFVFTQAGGQLTVKCIFGTTENSTVNWTGAIAGLAVGQDVKQHMEVNSGSFVTNISKGKVNFQGGLFGEIQSVSLSASDIFINAKSPVANSYFGGLTAKLNDGCIVQVNNITVSTKIDGTDYATISKGGGLIGETNSGSVLKLCGYTTLTNVRYTVGNTTGQLVGKQIKSLVYADGKGNDQKWTYNRASQTICVDDIGYSGQVIRLGGNLSEDLVTINENYEISFKDSSIGNYATINDADGFALHYITISTDNAFNIYSGIDVRKTSFGFGKSKIIDLTGTGLQSLTGEYPDSIIKFEGNTANLKNITISGNNTKLTYICGETYGLRNEIPVTEDAEGSGQCYRHENYGLINAANSIIIENLNVEATMNIGLDYNVSSGVSAGILIGKILGGYEGATVINQIRNVKISDSSINLSGNVPTSTYSQVGGMIGSVSGNETDLKINNSISNVRIIYSNNSENISIGGMIGRELCVNRFKFYVEDVAISGGITTNATNHAHIGGVLADIGRSAYSYATNRPVIKISGLSFDNYSLESKATKSSGGLLGYYWLNTDVSVDEGDYEYGILVGASIDGGTTSITSKGGSVGGLCYASSGQWIFGSGAIDYQKIRFDAKNGDVGMLFCHGEKQASTAGEYASNGYALFLLMKDYWQTSYKISENCVINGSPNVFDELVAYTAKSVNGVYDISLNDAGIISLHTSEESEDNKLNMSNGDRNSYINRTSYGNQHQTNPNSRYYYNLDQAMDSSIEGIIDTCEELLLWSVRKYCANNIKEYISDTGNIISGTFDLDGYSYYPISVTNETVTIQNATVIFYNNQIEQKETANKSTLYTDGTNSQHYMMHSGIFKDYYAEGSSTTLTISNTTILGTIGMVKDGSGALICGTIHGYDGKKQAVLKINGIVTDSAEKTLSVDQFSDSYAPLLINVIADNVVATISDITVKQNVAAATSLFGNVISSSGGIITVSLDKMVIPDSSTDNKFTLASFFHSIKNTTSVSYDFTQAEDWDTNNEHIKQVTYGYEIGGTIEYADADNPHQYYYSQSETYVTSQSDGFDGAHKDEFDNGYLPYVYISYNADDGTHEMKVNQSLTNLLSGCGTYGDPFVISNGKELQTIASYLSSKRASKDWTVNITLSETDSTITSFCSSKNEVKTHHAFKFDGGSWKCKEGETTITLSNDSVYSYLQNAYFMIEGDIEIKNFIGLGTKSDPFRGVLIGKNNPETDAKAKITLTGIIPQGFIVASYGSVVKNIEVEYTGRATLKYYDLKNGSGFTSESFFGGIIGAVMGGDNIIDNVSIIFNETAQDNKDRFVLTYSDSTNKHLIPIGGYVGVISGGGVIFRENIGLEGSINAEVESPDYFYANKYVGRVIQGFAVNEGTSEINNGNDNYKICSIDPQNSTNNVNVNDSEITVNNALGLFILSSITNSGGAGDGLSLAYLKNANLKWNNNELSYSKGGKVRNSDYSTVGNVLDAGNDSEYIKSLSDDYSEFGQGNSSYLDKKYANGSLYNICSNNSYSIIFKNEKYDMTVYGNGYRSISPRYLSNAVCKSNSEVSDYTLTNPLISSVTGNNAKILPNITVKEYTDDDHHAIGVGGLFNSIRFSNEAEYKDLSIGSSIKPSTVSHEFYRFVSSKLEKCTHSYIGGSDNNGLKNLRYEQGRGLIAVGGFAGNTVSDSDNIKNVSFINIDTLNLTIMGPLNAGGIIGQTGLYVSSDNAQKYSSDNICYHINYLVGTYSGLVIPTFTNCNYDSLNVDGGYMVGGYCGHLSNGNYDAAYYSENNGTAIVSYTDSTVAGRNSVIRCLRLKNNKGIDGTATIGGTTGLNLLPAAGGLFGSNTLKVNIDCKQTLSIANTDVRCDRSAAGIIGWALREVTVKNVSIIGKEQFNQIGDIPDYKTDTATGLCEFAGGIIGYYECNYDLKIDKVNVVNMMIAGSRYDKTYPSYAGGIVGNIKSSKNHSISNSKVQNVSLINDGTNQTGGSNRDGGIVGRLEQGNLKGVNLLSDSVDFKPKSSSHNGNLIGMINSNCNLYLAGVSIQNTKNLESINKSDVGNNSATTSYIAYADYYGKATSESESGSIITDTLSPYVTTSPSGISLDITKNGVTETLYLYGDGASPNTVSSIYSESENTDSKRFYYKKIGENTAFNNLYNSDFISEMGSNTSYTGETFSVLQVPVNTKDAVTKEINDYLDIITNGGYSKALGYNTSSVTHVSTRIELYQWVNDHFVLDTSSKTSLKKNGNGFETSFTVFDSGNDRFELLIVTFTEGDYSYEVRVPIVVRKMLEIDFTATLKDSPSFKKEDFESYTVDGFNPNITTGYGTTTSALLTYVYDRAIGVNQDYGWTAHIDNAGYMGELGQTIKFFNPNSTLKSLPKGTQLTLIDPSDNNKAYSYTVNTQSTTEGTNIRLTDFTTLDEFNNKINYSPKWLSEIVRATAATDDAGAWIKTGEISEATARVEYNGEMLYLKPKGNETGDTYKLAIDENVLKNQKPTQQFYLVIFIPESSVEDIPLTSGDEGKNLNGYLSTELTVLAQRTQVNINFVRQRADKRVYIDNHSSTESTYNYLSGYIQKLSDESNDKQNKVDTDPEAYVLLDNTLEDGNYRLYMDLVDEISVVRGQKDTVDTPLYFKEVVSLPNYIKTVNDSISLKSAKGFPTGCFGDVNFYVYVMNGEEKKYYTFESNGEQIAWNSESIKIPAIVYKNWQADGSNMELFFSLNNSEIKPVSLAGIREIAKLSGEKFYIETEIDIHMSVPAAEQVIAGSITKGNAFTKLSYTTYLSSSETGFTSTNYVESKIGEVRYYQSRSGNSTITHSANDSTQLGINCSDLTSANGVIYTTGVYDLTTVSNAENLIQDADKVVYTLTLWQKQEGGEYVQITDNLNNYISSVLIKDQPVSDQNGYQWTDVKNGKFSSIDSENNRRFLIPIRVQVNTDVETNGVTFANYQLRLTATLYKDSTILDQPVNAEILNEGITEYIRYDYVTYTITRILTNGYWGEE